MFFNSQINLAEFALQSISCVYGDQKQSLQSEKSTFEAENDFNSKVKQSTFSSQIYSRNSRAHQLINIYYHERITVCKVF